LYKVLILESAQGWIAQPAIAKFRQNRSIGCEDIKIFLFFKMAAVRHLGFWGHIWTTNSEYLGISITLQNLVMIDAVVFIM